VNCQVSIGLVNNSDVFAYVTTGGKINLYFPPNPHEMNSSLQSISTHSLNINKNITCLEFCALEDEEELENKEKQIQLHKPKTKDSKKDKNKEKEINDIERKSDVLFIGCETSLMCYDIMENRTLFDREITEGVLSMTCGRFSSFTEPLCLAGGNCNIVGVDINGEDKFWTVLGGNTICMALGDFDKDNKNDTKKTFN